MHHERIAPQPLPSLCVRTGSLQAGLFTIAIGIVIEMPLHSNPILAVILVWKKPERMQKRQGRKTSGLRL